MEVSKIAAHIRFSKDIEPHHIRRLTDGGPDHPRWIAGVCPNCHRRAHYSSDAEAYNTHLGQVIGVIEQLN